MDFSGLSLTKLIIRLVLCGICLTGIFTLSQENGLTKWEKALIDQLNTKEQTITFTGLDNLNSDTITTPIKVSITPNDQIKNKNPNLGNWTWTCTVNVSKNIEKKHYESLISNSNPNAFSLNKLKEANNQNQIKKWFIEVCAYSRSFKQWIDDKNKPKLETGNNIELSIQLP